MRIQSSAVSLDSSRSYEEFWSQNVSVLKWNASTGAITNIAAKASSSQTQDGPISDATSSDSSGTFQDTLTDLKNRFEETQSVRVSQLQDKLQSMDRMRKNMIDYLIQMLFNKKMPFDDMANDTSDSYNFDGYGALQAGSGSGGHYESSFYYSESEYTSLDAKASVVTSDGRTIDVNMTLELSRSFVESTSQIIDYGAPMLCDPLVINLDVPSAQVSDQKFLFDLDCDGNEEEISKLNAGSGFLALDKNSDGVINDGSELFGTASGNGFADLAKYDQDGNGWIDEADDIFDQLRIWTKDANGEDKLCALGKAGVGAIYLGSSSTDFSLKNAQNNTNGVIRSTGLFLYENGNSGTVQQLDLAK